MLWRKISIISGTIHLIFLFSFPRLIGVQPEPDLEKNNYYFTQFLISNNFVYQKALIRTFHTRFWHQNSLCEFTTLKHKNPVLNVVLKISVIQKKTESKKILSPRLHEVKVNEKEIRENNYF